MLSGKAFLCDNDVQEVVDSLTQGAEKKTWEKCDRLRLGTCTTHSRLGLGGEIDHRRTAGGDCPRVGKLGPIRRRIRFPKVVTFILML